MVRYVLFFLLFIVLTIPERLNARDAGDGIEPGTASPSVTDSLTSGRVQRDSLADRGWHWYSDYPLAIAIGYSFGKLVSHPDGGSDAVGPAPSDDAGVAFQPFVSEREVGLSLRYSF